MPTETDLRDILQDGPDEPGALDADRIIRRARARRLPKRIAVGVGGSLAAVALVVPVALGVSAAGGGLAGSAADKAGSPDGDSATLREDAQSEAAALGSTAAALLNPCGGAVADVAPDPSGLVLEVAPVEAAAGRSWIDATVTLRNTGTERIEGTTGSAPVLTLSRDGVVLWHSDGPATDDLVTVDLPPGASMSYPAVFAPVVCGAGDDLTGDGFPAGLPAVGAGDYALSAAIELVSVDGGAVRLVTGPAAPVVLR